MKPNTSLTGKQQDKGVRKASPLFSIIMPCYNSEDYVERAIKSCTEQTFQDWELIIINDGSTDRTLEIISDYSAADNRISVFSKENGGYVSAVNLGLNYIKGRYFLLLGSDDELSSSLFSDIYEYITSSPSSPDMIGFRTLVYKNESLKIDDKYTLFKFDARAFSATIKEFISFFPRHAVVFTNRDTSKLYKTEILGSLRYFGSKGVDADGIFSMMFAHKASSFVCVPVIGYIWHQREGSVSGRKFDYLTQKDRMNNWIEFGEWLMQSDPSLVTGNEMYGLVYTHLNIVREMYIEYKKDCKKDKILDLSRDHIYSVIDFCKYKDLSKELKAFLGHPIIWKMYAFSKTLYRKAKSTWKKEQI